MPVTLKDVARAANVTPIVVSKVLHSHAEGVRVSEETAERIRQAAKDLNYRVNMRGRILRSQRTGMIGVLNGMGMDRPRFNNGPRYFASLMDGIVEGAFKHSYSVALCPVLLGQNPTEAMNDGRFDGLVWYSVSPSESNLAVLEQCNVPVVIVHARASDFLEKHPTVHCDNPQGVGLAVDHLVSLGHRRIAFGYEVDRSNVETLSRLEGFKFHMAKHGLTVAESDIIDFPADGEALRVYLSRERPHTAVICHADGLAADFLNISNELGIRIPDELSVIGFDSTEFCEQFRPMLTSIYQPLFAMGEEAVNALMACLGGHKPQILEKVLPCCLDVRDSTAPPPRAMIL